MLETLYGKMTAGLAFRFETVALLAGSALVIATYLGVQEGVPPITLLDRAAHWLGLDWTHHMQLIHSWLVDRSNYVFQAAWAGCLLGLLVAWLIARHNAPQELVSNLRWTATVAASTAVLAEVEGPLYAYRPVLALVACGAVAALLKRDWQVLMSFVLAPVVLAALPMLAVASLVGGGVRPGRRSDVAETRQPADSTEPRSKQAAVAPRPPHPISP
jgi:hypothetical protein